MAGYNLNIKKNAQAMLDEWWVPGIPALTRLKKENHA